MLLAAVCAFSFACTKITTQTSLQRGSSWSVPGLLRIGVRQEPDTLNPVLAQQQIDVDIAMFWAGFLLVQDDRGRFVPELAAQVPTRSNGGITDGGRTITYRLRRGVHWHDGAAFSAADVIFSWHAVTDPRNNVPSRVGYELIRSIEKHDDYTLAVHLVRPYAPFVSTFFTSVAAYAYCVLPRHLLVGRGDINQAPYNFMPVGTGPFRVTRYEPHNLVRLVANERYWRGPPKLKRVDVRIIPNDNTLATLTKTHEIDVYYRVPHILTRTLREVNGVVILSSPFTRFADIGFNTRSATLADVRVRRALALATDKQALLQRVTAGGDIPADSDQPPFLWAHNTHVLHYPHDPIRAAKLLDQAGWRLGSDGVRRKNAVPLRLNFAGASGDAVSIRAREVMQAQWRQVGVEADIKSYPSDILFAPLSAGGIEMTGRYDVVFESFANGADPDDSILFECRWRPPAGENVYQICNSALDAAEESALSSNKLSVRKANYDKIQDILAEQLPILPLWFERYDYALNADLKNFSPGHVGSPFWNTWMWEI